MLVIVVVLFALCWLPLQAYNVLQDVFPEINKYRYINIVWFCFDWLAMSNSCYNPFIYGIYNVSFKSFSFFFFKRGNLNGPFEKSTFSPPPPTPSHLSLCLFVSLSVYLFSLEIFLKFFIIKLNVILVRKERFFFPAKKICLLSFYFQEKFKREFQIRFPVLRAHGSSSTYYSSENNLEMRRIPGQSPIQTKVTIKLSKRDIDYGRKKNFGR